MRANTSQNDFQKSRLFIGKSSMGSEINAHNELVHP